MKRYSHVWRGGKPGRSPSQLVIVDCESERKVVNGHTTLERESLLSWHAVALRMESGRVSRRVERSGCDTGSWWDQVEYLARRGASTWVFCLPASRIWSLLGVWEALESGRITLTGNDNGRADTGQGSMPEVRHGTDGHEGERGSNADRDMSYMRPGFRRDRASEGVRGTDRPRKVLPGYIVLEDPPNVISARARTGGGRLTFVDLRNYGLDSPAGMSSAQDRVLRWETFVLDMMNVLNSRHGVSLRSTAGSQSVHLYRCNYLKSPIWCHDHQKALALERDSYYGGRCEVLQMGKQEGSVYHLDVRSLYPSLCLECWLPARLVDYVESPQEDDAKAAIAFGNAIADVTVSTSEPAYPLRVGRSSDQKCYPISFWKRPTSSIPRGQVIWPIGTFRTALAGPELADAINRGRIDKVHSLAWYRGEAIFSSFMADMIDLIKWAKGCGKADLASWLKRVAVALPGKMGQTDSRWIDCDYRGYCEPYGRWQELAKDGVTRTYRSIAGHVQQEIVGPHAPESVPSVAAWVTSLGRMVLLEALRTCPVHSVYYCDTDSLFCNRDAYLKLCELGMVDSERYGSWRLVARYGSFEALGYKHYRCDGVLKCSGMPRGTAEHGPDDSHYWYRQWLSQITEKGKRPEAERVLLGYGRSEPYWQRRVLEGGITVPIVINE